MEATQKRYHYELNPKYLAGNDLMTIMEQSKISSDYAGRNDKDGLGNRLDTSLNKVQGAYEIPNLTSSTAFEKRLNEEDVKNTLTHQMSTTHRTQTFLSFVRQLIMCIKTIEDEKTTLANFKDFNLNDAFKVILYGIKPYAARGSALSSAALDGKKKDVGDLELNTSLLLFPG